MNWCHKMRNYGNFGFREEPLLREKTRREPKFYYAMVEDIVPKNHLLRLINKHIDFSFIRGRGKPFGVGNEVGNPKGVATKTSERSFILRGRFTEN